MLKYISIFLFTAVLIAGCTSSNSAQDSSSAEIYPEYTVTLHFSSDKTRAFFVSGENRQELESGVATSFPSFSEFDIELEPEPGYYFHSWTNCSWQTRPDRSFMLDEDKELTARIEALPPGEERTLIMLYYATAHDLEYMAMGDIGTMAYDYGLMLSPEERSKLTLLILYDDLGESPGESCYLMELSPNRLDRGLAGLEIEPWWTGRDIDTSSPASLEAFLAYSKENYADYDTRALIISGHGSGYRNIAAVERNRSVAYDSDQSGAGMVIDQLGQALLNQGCSPETLDIIGLNMCSSGSFEDYYELRNTAQYFLACPWIQTGFWTGFGFIDEAAKATSPEELARAIAWVALEKNTKSQSEETDNALAVLETQGSETVKSAIDQLAVELSQLPLSQVETFFDPALYQPSTHGSSSRYDLGRICQAMVAQGIAAEAAQNVIDSFSAISIYSWADVNAGNYEGENIPQGLVISYPDRHEFGHFYSNFEEDYNSQYLSFSTVTVDGQVESWTELLNYFYSASGGY